MEYSIKYLSMMGGINLGLAIVTKGYYYFTLSKIFSVFTIINLLIIVLFLDQW